MCNIDLCNENECTQCFTCVAVCPQNCITMVPSEAGFSKPAIDRNKCIECGLCMKSCHQKGYSPYLQRAIPQNVYASWSKDNKIRQSSSSGGIFSVFASYILKREGVVFGASFVEGLHLRHVAVADVFELKKLRGSKYLQSDLSGCYEEVKEYLQLDKYVLFTGTPCQIAGLYAFLKKDYAKLYTCDVICHGVPSQAAFDLYCEKINLSLSHCVDFKFRYLKGWGFQLSYNDISIPVSDCYYMNAFSKGYMFMESCYKCPYAKLERISDITMADFWGIGKHGRPFKKDVVSGVSLVIDNVGNMMGFISPLISDVYIEERSLDEALYENHNLKASVKREKERNTAIQDLINPNISLIDFATKYKLLKKLTLESKIKRQIKKLIYALNLYNFYKSISYRLK